jgi:hypothetical protein
VKIFKRSINETNSEEKLLLLLQLHSADQVQQSKTNTNCQVILNETQVRPIEDDEADDDANQFCTQQHHQSKLSASIDRWIR